VIIFISGLFSGYVKSEDYKYETKYIEVPVDHFSFARNDSFKLRYLVNDSYTPTERYLQQSAPIWFYTGNEGDIELFAQNTGFMWDLVKDIPGTLVFCEHRFYGKSMPFGNQTISYKSPEHLGYLTSEQALADFADLLQFLNPQARRPVIVMGGSYGGMLSAWFRSKYPHLVTGALASSAPVLQFPGVVPCDTFSMILTSVYENALNRSCSVNIKNSWNVLTNYSKTDAGRKFLNDKFKFCSKMNSTADMDKFFDYMNDVYGNLAMANYPYPANFLAPLPAYPVRQFCRELEKVYTNNEELLSALQAALSVYTNFTGKTNCLDYASAYDTRMGDNGWEFQACTEMVMPMCNNEKSMFPPEKWDFNKYSDNCFKKFGVRPREHAAITEYGKLESATNIIFSNGLMDPWAGGGMLKSDSESIHIIIIPEGAHHIDLRAKNKEDPESVILARKEYKDIFRGWIRDHLDKQNSI
jgi:lysosomal Pro-X carboxypeptidase